MQFHIRHTTTYTYSASVLLQPHWIRLRPRVDGIQSLQSFRLQIEPQFAGMSSNLDPQGNVVTQVWFPDRPTQSLTIQTESSVITDCENPFAYLLEPWATHFPLNYPMQVLTELHPYWGNLPGETTGLSPELRLLACELQEQAQDNVSRFLSLLNQRIYETCEHQIRDTGNPWSADLTWIRRAGSCRDLTVLFMEVCRFVGLAARFVSGYQAGDPDNPERHLHAWVEVYLPGAGWRGYDPTHGLVVAADHVAVMASAFPAEAAPVMGDFRHYDQQRHAVAELSYALSIQTSD